jgi:hypothetical protein
VKWSWHKEESRLVLNLQPSRYFYKVPAEDAQCIFGLSVLRRRGLPDAVAETMPDGDYLADWPEVTAIENAFLDVWWAFRYCGPKGALSRELYREAQ